MSSHHARRALVLALLFAVPAAATAAACAVSAAPGLARRGSTATAAGPSRVRFGAGLTDCSWSFFGDPRALVHGVTLLTGCVTSRGRVGLVRANRASGARTVMRLFGRLEADDHNNPSLVFWRGRLWAFSSPHSGHTFPLDRHMFVHYRESREAYGLAGGFGAVRSVPLPKGCGWGYTYPNPVVSGGRLYLFVRGPCLQPIFTWTADGRRWARSRTLMLGQPRPGGRQRPYAKYAGGRDGISMIFSDGHPYSCRTSLYYMRLSDGRFYRADRSLIGGLRDLPFRAPQLDPVYHYRTGGGRAWPMDVALDPRTGSPVVVYTRSSQHGDRFFYATFAESRWTSRLAALAGGHYGGYSNGGASLRHEAPSWLALAADQGGETRWTVRLLHTPDGGRTWSEVPLPREPRQANFRPVFPRGLPAGAPPLLEWVDGSAPDFRRYHTQLHVSGARPRSRRAGRARGWFGGAPQAPGRTARNPADDALSPVFGSVTNQLACTVVTSAPAEWMVAMSLKSIGTARLNTPDRRRMPAEPASRSMPGQAPVTSAGCCG